MLIVTTSSGHQACSHDPCAQCSVMLSDKTFTPSPTARRAQADTGVRAQSARSAANRRIENTTPTPHGSRPCSPEVMKFRCYHSFCAWSRSLRILSQLACLSLSTEHVSIGRPGIPIWYRPYSNMMSPGVRRLAGNCFLHSRGSLDALLARERRMQRPVISIRCVVNHAMEDGVVGGGIADQLVPALLVCSFACSLFTKKPIR
jgi:hypothetical protein